MNKLEDILVIGCGGHCRFVISITRDNKYIIKGLIDINEKYDKSETILGFNVLGNLGSLDSLYKKGIKNAVIAVGNNKLRNQIYKKLIDIGFNLPNITHSSAYIDASASIGNANVIGPNVVIGSEVKIGNNNIINTSAVIEHQSVVGNSNHVSLSSVLCGKVNIGNSILVGANSTIIENISICNDVTIGAGTTVTSSIEKKGSLIVGNKSRLIKK